jgi:hypothetical protein
MATKEIKQISGFEDIGELRDALPDNPDAPPKEPEKKKRGKKSTTRPSPVTTSADPMSDPLYAAACARMTAFGGKGMIERGFQAGAKVLDDETFELDDKERAVWDDFFLVLSKKPLFDVGKPIYLALFFIITLLSQLGWRVFERTNNEFLTQLFQKKMEGETDGHGTPGIDNP